MVIIFGPAGSGKSVQGKLLADKYNWLWLSAGELLRNSNDAEVKKIMDSGQLAPNDKVNKIVADGFNQAVDVEKVVLDGFPRCVDQARWLLDNSPLNGHSVSEVLVLDVNKEELIKRLTLRARADDTIEAIEKRFNTYYLQTHPVVDFFVSRGIRIHHIDGVGTREEVHKRIIRELEKNAFKSNNKNI